MSFSTILDRTTFLLRSAAFALLLAGTVLTTNGCAAEADEGDEPSAESADELSTGAKSFFTYNICGGDSNCKVADPVKAIVDNVVAHKPVAFALQEVCSNQANQLSRELRARGLHYVQRFQNAAPLGFNVGCGGLNGWGNAVFHVGEQLGQVEANAYRAQGGITRPQNRNYVCVRVPNPSFWACSTHIDLDARLQKSQLEELSGVVSRLTSVGGKDVPVLLGGDFNVSPSSTSLDPLFATSYQGGRGRLLEADILPDRTFGAEDATHGTSKIDFIFRTPNVQVTSSRVVNATSDHRLLLNSVVFK